VVSGAVTDSGTKETVKAEAGTPESVVPVQVQKAIAVTVNGEDKPALVPAPIVEPAAPEKAAVVVIAPEPAPVSPKAGEPAVKPAAPVVVQAVAAQIPVTTPAKDDAFINTSRQPVDEFTLRPASIRPLPVKADKAEMFASPAPARPAAESKDSARPKTSEIYIHSWKAEVASCPWNENNRLMRVTVQLPADQPAAMSQAAHPLQVAFDPATVREYRQLCERHLPAAELRSAGTHVVWYEFQPNGDTGKTVATVTLPNGRFTTQTVGPFDSSKLAVLDKGQSWQTAREDFIFESSVVAFGMLLRGVHQTPRLDHGLVLALAQKAKGADATGERGRFIRLVNEAKKAAGL